MKAFARSILRQFYFTWLEKNGFSEDAFLEQYSNENLSFQYEYGERRVDFYFEANSTRLPIISVPDDSKTSVRTQMTIAYIIFCEAIRALEGLADEEYYDKLRELPSFLQNTMDNVGFSSECE